MYADIAGKAHAVPAISALTQIISVHQPLYVWWRILLSLGLVAVATALGFPLHALIARANLVMLYLAAVVVAATYLDRVPSMVAAVAGVLAFNFFFTEPRFTLVMSDPEDIITFTGLFMVGLVVSTLAARAREQAESARQHESQIAALYELSRDLTAAADLDAVVQGVTNHVSHTFGRESVILLAEGEELKSRQPASFPLDENEWAVAVRSFRSGQPAGRGTDTLPGARLHYLPLKTVRRIVGVLGVKTTDPNLHLTPEQRRLLESFAGQAALAVEREQLAEQARQAELLKAADKLQTALLNSISHDLRTPLVAITGALSSLQDDAASLNEAARQGLIEMAREEAERLNRLVGNLLDMSRIEAGALRLKQVPCDVQDVIGTALERLSSRLGDHPVTVEVPPDLPLVPMDFVLIVQALANILDNAVKYSPPGSPIRVTGRLAGAGESLEIAVADQGIGIPAEDLTRVFDKFYRAQRTRAVSGTGLGLAIAKGIVEAHGGRIWAENRPGGGTVVTLALPVQHVLAISTPRVSASKHRVTTTEGQP